MNLLAAAAAAMVLTLAPAASEEVVYTTWADCGTGSEAVYSGTQDGAERVATRYERKGCTTTITFWPDWVSL